MKLFWFCLPLAQLYKLRNAYLKHRQHIFTENCRFQLIKFLYECIFNVHFWRKIADLGLLYSFMNVFENVQQHSVSLVCSGAKHKACNHSFLEIKDFKVPNLHYISLYFLERKKYLTILSDLHPVQNFPFVFFFSSFLFGYQSSQSADLQKRRNTFDWNFHSTKQKAKGEIKTHLWKEFSLHQNKRWAMPVCHWHRLKPCFKIS